MRTNGRYRIVGVQGKPTDTKGRIVTLEDVEEAKKATARDEIRELKRSFIIMSVISVILAVFCIWVVSYRTNAQIAEITAEEIASEDYTSDEMPVPTFETESGYVSVIISDTDFYIESVPLDYAKQEALFNAAEEFGVPYELAIAVVWKESRFRNISGDNGEASGYMQIWKRWHSNRMQELGVSDLNDYESNFRVGCSYLGELLDRYGNTHKALMAYNAGENGAAEMWAQGYASSGYSREVVQYMEDLQYGESI